MAMTFPGLLSLSLVFYKVVGLAKKIRDAKRTGLPYTVAPVLDLNTSTTEGVL